MDKNQFLEDVKKQSASFSKEQKELVQTMLQTVEKHENTFENGTLYCKKIKDKEQEQPLNLFTIGVKERPLSFVHVTLNLDTNEIKTLHSGLEEKTVSFSPDVDPEGEITIKFKPYHTIYSVQKLIN